MIEIPLRNGAEHAHQVFTMLLGENLLEFELNYITVSGPAWSLDISKEGELIVVGAMLEPGVDVVETFNADIGSLVFVGEEPTINNLGDTNSLVWVAS